MRARISDEVLRTLERELDLSESKIGAEAPPAELLEQGFIEVNTKKLNADLSDFNDFP